MKSYRKNLFIPTLKITIDAILIEAAFLFSFWFRFYSPFTSIIPVTKGQPPFHNYLIASFILVLIYLILFGTMNSYRSRHFSTFTQDIPVVLKTCVLGILFAMSGAFLYRGFSYSRLTFLLMFINTTIFLLVGRYVFHRLRRFLMKGGYGLQRFLVVGSSKQIPWFFSQLERDLNHNLEILGYLSDTEMPDVKTPYLGAFTDLKEHMEKLDPDAILLAFDDHEHEMILKIMKDAEGKNIELFYLPDLLDMITSSRGTLEVGGIPIFRLKAIAFSGWQGFWKRAFDIVVSFLGLILLSPLLLLVALLVKISSIGPVFYKQERVGLDGQEFKMIKFRTMVVDAEKGTGPVWAKKDDPRTTSLGKFLRRTSIDEFPQLINVLKGEMSLVGPRPERLVFVKQFQQQVSKYAERHRVRSGITGWAQVNGLRGQSPIEERTRYDVYYIENWSLWFDIKIILMTFMAIFRGENAY
jgi:exopolysaccharide biosynthesis polyprenyl glycosylphosphotransferase